MDSYQELQNGFYQTQIPREKMKETIKELEELYDPEYSRWEHDTLAVWITRDNRAIPIQFMRESHMENAYNFCIRLAYQIKTKHDNDLWALEPGEIEQFLRIVRRIRTLVIEAKRRNLKICPEPKRDIEELAEEFDDLLRRDEEYDDWSWHPGHPDNFGDN